MSDLVDLYPKRFVVVCCDGVQRHDGYFDSLDEAVRYADQGHCCVGVRFHDFVTLVEVSPGATLTIDEARSLLARREREARCKRCQIDERFERYSIDSDEYLRLSHDVPHTCHDDELTKFVEERSPI